MWQRLSGMFILLLLAVLPSRAQSADMMVNLTAQLSQHLFDERSSAAGARGYTYACPVFGRCNHRIVGLFIDQVGGRQRAWVVAAYPNEDDCHACTSRMTVEIYDRKAGRWHKTAAFRNFTEWGDWGTVAPKEVKLARLDRGRAVLFLDLSFMGQGYVEESMRAFLVSDARIRAIGGLSIGEDNSGAVEDEAAASWWKATYQVQDGERGRPELVVRVTDNRGKLSISRFRITAGGLTPLGRVDRRLLQ